MSKAGKEILAGAEEALAYLKGDNRFLHIF